MELKGLAIFIVAHTYYGLTRAMTPDGEVRMDDNIHYFSSQDIRAFFKTTPPLWFYGKSYPKNFNGRDTENSLLHSSQEKCIYFRQGNLNDSYVNFTKHYTVDEKDEKKPLYGKFFTTDGLGDDSSRENRTKPNGVIVSDSPGLEGGQDYKLVFTDYKGCALIRPFSLKETEIMEPPYERYPPHQSYPKTKGICIVLLGDQVARKVHGHFPGNLPPLCRRAYPKLCGTESSIKVLFETSCPGIPNVLGC